MGLGDILRSPKGGGNKLQAKQVDYSTWESQLPSYEPIVRGARRRWSRFADAVVETSANCAEPSSQDATIVCVGDLLCEEKLYKACKTRLGFDFSGVYQFVRPLVIDSDLAIANLETTICESAPYTGEQYKIEGKYHNNAPVEFLEAIRDAGFDFLMLANNHSLDSGIAGVVETIRHIDDLGMLHTGLFAPGMNRYGSVVDVNGIKIGLLSYSTWYNRNESRLTDEGRCAIINQYSPERVRSDIEDLRASGAEFVLVYMHWGIDAEYKSKQSASMEVAAREVANAGADYIIGSHTHSVQPYTQIPSDDGRLVPCVFSMGNFVTSERSTISRDNLLLRIRLKRIGGKVVVASEKAIPCHVPDSFMGVAYPVIPRDEGFSSVEGVVECCNDRFRKTSETVGRLSLQEGERFVLTKVALCSFLGLPAPSDDCCFTSIRFAMDAQPGCVAVVSEITSDPRTKTSSARKIELAEVARSKGAVLLLSDEAIDGYDCLLVPDMFEAYCKVVAGIRDHFSPKTIAITGSIGKTTTTEMVRSVIRSKFKDTHYNTGSANNVRYCGTVVQNLRTNHGHYVQELMEGPPFGAASTISKIVKPQAAVVTVVGTSHLEHFGSQERILESCLGVQDGMPQDGLLILNGDDPWQRAAAPRLKAVYYGIDDEHADFRASNISCRDGRLRFDVLQAGGGSTPIVLQSFGRHNVLDALAAFAAGKWAGMTEEEIAKGLAAYKPEGIRQNFVKIGGYSIFLDCYNSSKESVASSLDALSMMEKEPDGRYVAVLADVMETGDAEEEVHREIGRIAAASCIDLLICYGVRAAYIAEEARACGMPQVLAVDTPGELVDIIKANVTTKDIVMLKGSHGMALEQIADAVWGTWYHEEFERYDFVSRSAKDSDFEYVVYSDHAVVKKKLSSRAAVDIPSMVEGVPVTGLADSLFNRSRYTEEVVLPEGLINIRYCTFYKADKLTRIDIPSSVRIIHTSAFSTCANLKEVVIRKGCVHLGKRAFGNCPNLESVFLPETIAQIDDEAFLNCTKLTIYGKSGTFAEHYAATHGIAFKEAPPAFLLPGDFEIGGGVSCFLLDATNDVVLFEQGSDSRRMIASLAKLALMYRALKQVESGVVSPNAVIRLGDEVSFARLGGTDPRANSTVRGRVDGEQKYLEPGEMMSLESLLSAMMIVSGNDAASAVACVVDGSEEAFLAWFNDGYSKELELSSSTHFGRAYGRDCYSTARDLGRMVASMLADDAIVDKFWALAGAETTEGSVSIRKNDGEEECILRKNTHSFIAGAYRSWLMDLLGADGRICGKTGTWIHEYGLVTAADTGERTIVCVVLGAAGVAERDEATLALMRYAVAR